MIQNHFDRNFDLKDRKPGSGLSNLKIFNISEDLRSSGNYINHKPHKI